MSAPCCALRSKNALIVVLLIALAVTTTGWILEARKQPPAPVEMVEILVAAKDLNTGTMFTKGNNDRLTKLVARPKSDLPAEYVTDREFFVGKRIARPIREGEPFKPSDVAKPLRIFEEGKEIMSIVLPQSEIPGVGPESRVDILATHPADATREAFVLLADVPVLAVNGISEIRREGDPRPFSNNRDVVFAVDEQQATLLKLAEQRGCKLELRSPPRKDWSYEATLKRLQPRPEVAPPPRVKE